MRHGALFRFGHPQWFSSDPIRYLRLDLLIIESPHMTALRPADESQVTNLFGAYIFNLAPINRGFAQRPRQNRHHRLTRQPDLPFTRMLPSLVFDCHS